MEYQEFYIWVPTGKTINAVLNEQASRHDSPQLYFTAQAAWDDSPEHEEGCVHRILNFGTFNSEPAAGYDHTRSPDERDD